MAESACESCSGANKRAFKDCCDDAGGARKKAKKTKHPVVVSYTRRTDGVADAAQLESFLSALKTGVPHAYPHPLFKSEVEYDVGEASVISWWSKDYKNLIAAWPKYDKVLSRFKHHFNIAINGPERSALEPGVASTLEERYAQLAWLVGKCRELGQPLNSSVIVKVDPITVYRCKGEEEWRDTTGHVPSLCAAMKALGLTRMHISFTQVHQFRRTKARLDEYKAKGLLEVRELVSNEDQLDLYRKRIEPHVDAAGIHVQTCSATALVSASRLLANPVAMGACCGWRDVEAITGVSTGNRVEKPKVSEEVRTCLCYPHRDVGSKAEPCTHGCRYCMANPKIYEW